MPKSRLEDQSSSELSSPSTTARSQSPLDSLQENYAETMERYDRLEHDFRDMTARPPTRERVRAHLGVLNEIYETCVENSDNTQLIHKDAQVFSASMSAVNSYNDEAGTSYMRVLDAKQFERSLSRRIAEHGLEAFLMKSATVYPSRAALPVVVPREFGVPEARTRGPREKKIRETGPAKQTVAFDQNQENHEAAAIASIKAHLKQVYLATGEPVPYFQFILNRDSFPQTVENLFYLSFLVRDNYIAVNFAKDPSSTTIRPLFRRPPDSGENEPTQVDNPPTDQEEDSYIIEGRPDSDYLGQRSGAHALFLAEMGYDTWLELRDKYPGGGIPSRRSTDESEYTRLRE